jgi:hypothetical protein
MILAQAWGAPGPPISATTRGWILLKSRKARFVVLLTSALTVLALIGLIAPSAGAAPKNQLLFVTGHQPRDAEVNDTIRAADLNDTAAFVQVQLADPSGNPLATSGILVSFRLATGTGFASGTLNVVPQETDANGIATFGEGTLSIGTKNEPQFTDYALVPVTAQGQPLTGPRSDGFDVWEDGEACTGGTDTCDASLRNGNEQYQLGAAGSLGASQLSSVLPGLQCPKQRAIFPNAVFSYATTGSAPLAPVHLISHVTAEDWRASANNGQAHADWCIGLVDKAPWVANGARFVQRDTDGNGSLDLYVALAPNCPVANPSAFAPCIVSQNPDGDGGSLTIGWLTGGDPPRRT